MYSVLSNQVTFTVSPINLFDSVPVQRVHGGFIFHMEAANNLQISIFTNESTKLKMDK